MKLSLFKSYRGKFIAVYLITSFISTVTLISYQYIKTIQHYKSHELKDITRESEQFVRSFHNRRNQLVDNLKKVDQGIKDYLQNDAMTSSKQASSHYLELMLNKFVAIVRQNRNLIFNSLLFDQNKQPIFDFDLLISNNVSSLTLKLQSYLSRLTEKSSISPIDFKKSYEKDGIYLDAPGYVELIEYPLIFQNRNYGCFQFSIKLFNLIRQEMQQINLSERQSLLVITQNKEIVFSDDEAQLYRPLNRIFPNLKNLSNHIFKHEKGNYQHRYLVSEKKMNYYDFRCFILSDLQSVLQQARKDAVFNFLIYVLVIFLGLGIIWFVNIRFVQQVNQMVNLSEQISIGHFESTIPLIKEAELSRLGNALIKMKASLQQLIREQTEKKKLTEVNQFKSKFMADVAHDLRAPLNSVSVGLSNLKDGIIGTLNKRQKEYILKIQRSLQHLNFMIGEVSTFSKIQAKQLTLNPTKFSVADLISDIKCTFQELARQKKLKLDFQNSTSQDFLIQADREKLYEILINLLDNAIKNTPSNGNITLKYGTKNTKAIIFEIKDSGIGIEPDYLKYLNSNQKQSIKRKGRGLFIVKNLVALHQGTMTIESQLKQGTKVTIILPQEQLK